MLFVILGIVVLLFFWGCGAYNNLIGVDQEVKTKWGNVETNYQRRTDLYSSVIKTIEGSANFEKSTLREVVEARSKATSVNVDINDPARLNLLIAATLSPPPIRENAPFFVASAIANAITLVPC